MRNLYSLTVICCLNIFAIFAFLPNEVKAQELMSANLYVVDANGLTLMDGNLTNYSSTYSNQIDNNDIWKMINPGLNFGILRDGVNLVVERRNIIAVNDTTFFRMWNMMQLNYQIRFVLKNLNHPGLVAFIKDNYLGTESKINTNDTSYFNFTIDASPASAGESRFQLIYKTVSLAPLDVNFTGIQAQRKGKDINVEWKVSNEISMESYSVEHSYDGRNFQSIQTLPSFNNVNSITYNYADLNVATGDIFYRIKGTSLSGKIQYSTIVKVNALASDKDVIVYPNPVVNKKVQLRFINLPVGTYNVDLVNMNGMKQPLSSIQINDGQSFGTILLPQNLVPGMYILRLTGKNQRKIVKTIQVL